MDLMEQGYLSRIADALEKIADALSNKKEKVTYSIKGDIDEPVFTDAWVVLPYNQCLLSMPPQYLSTIYHYHDDTGLNVDALERGGTSKIFWTEKGAIEYCSMLGTTYNIIDIPNPKTIVIGDDYE